MHWRQTEDHYAFLGISPSASTETIERALEVVAKRAQVLANVQPEVSRELQERIRNARSDLLAGETARNRYDAHRQTRLQESPLMRDRTSIQQTPDGEERTYPPFERRSTATFGGSASLSDVSGRGARPWLIGLLLVVAIAAIAGGLGFALARDGALSTGAPTVAMTLPTSTSAPTATADSSTAPPVATPQVVVSPAWIPTSTPAVTTSTDIVNAVAAYNDARKLRWGRAYDTSQVGSTTTGVARAAVMCLVDSDGKNIRSIGAYVAIEDTGHTAPLVAIHGNIATLQEHKSDVQTEWYADGKSGSTHEEFEVTYTLWLVAGTWKVSNYQWVADSGATGNASQDAARCG